MEGKLDIIEKQLYRGETNFPPLRDLLLRSGELRAWFKYYNGPNQWAQRYYMEEHVYLTDQVIIVACLYRDGRMQLNTFKLEEISRVQREYAFEDKSEQKLILASATITLKRSIDKKHPDVLVYKRPLPEEQGDPAGFENFMSLLP